MKARDYFDKRLPREKLLKMFIFKDKCSNAWKLVAKKWWMKAEEMRGRWGAEIMKRIAAQADADRRLALLRRALPLLKTNTFPNKYLIEDVEKELGDGKK